MECHNSESRKNPLDKGKRIDKYTYNRRDRDRLGKNETLISRCVCVRLYVMYVCERLRCKKFTLKSAIPHSIRLYTFFNIFSMLLLGKLEK